MIWVPLFQYSLCGIVRKVPPCLETISMLTAPLSVLPPEEYVGAAATIIKAVMITTAP
jgi:hypothetical protein